MLNPQGARGGQAFFALRFSKITDFEKIVLERVLGRSLQR